jgi:cytidylate kinase
VLIAIDGPAGAGKSTVARALAARLHFAYLDSGAMYRCVALLSLETPGRSAAALAHDARIELAQSQSGGAGAVLLDGRDVSTEIRAPEVSQAASMLAADPAVRSELVDKQRALLADGDWVAEGRDIGSVVAPEAELKVFLTASRGERARRRARQQGGDRAAVEAEHSERDERDSSRAHSPLRPADGAVELDTTGLDIDQVVARISALAERRR